MTVIRLRYVVRRRGNLFWQPTPEMRSLGFQPKPLGVDGPEAHAEAGRLYQSWLEAKARGTAPVVTYPAGSFGAYYQRFRRTKKFGRLKIRSREDYDRAWKHLGPEFGQKTLTRITATDVEDFDDELSSKVSANERYRVMKVLRALFSDAIIRLRLNIPSPAKAVSNPQPNGRSQIWLASEIAKLIEGAVKLEHYGMALAIRIAWETLFSPVDIWTLPKSALKRDAGGRYLERARTKTSKEAFGAISQATSDAIDAYLKGLGVALTPGAPIIRRKSGNAYTHKNYFALDFRTVREAVFPGDTRQFMDIRRSGNVEADAAGADKKTMGEILANNLATSTFLDETYTPPTVAKARQIAELREEGRRRLEHELANQRQRSKSTA